MNFNAEAALFDVASISLSLSSPLSHLSSCGFSLANDDAFSRGRVGWLAQWGNLAAKFQELPDHKTWLVTSSVSQNGQKLQYSWQCTYAVHENLYHCLKSTDETKSKCWWWENIWIQSTTTDRLEERWWSQNNDMVCLVYYKSLCLVEYETTKWVLVEFKVNSNILLNICWRIRTKIRSFHL